MKHLVSVGIVVAVSTLAVAFSVVDGGSLSTKANKTDTSTKRKMLWESFLKDCPPAYLPVEVYAEDDSLTLICYRSKLKTLLYSLKDRSVRELNHAKGVGAVNRISYHAKEDEFILWYNGRKELAIFGVSAH